MCISYPGRVVAFDGPDAVIATIGRRRRATTLLVPDTAVGDWVMVASGSILRRLDDAEASWLMQVLDAATAPARLATQGGRS